jgi:hypothetical protein
VLDLTLLLWLLLVKQMVSCPSIYPNGVHQLIHTIMGRKKSRLPLGVVVGENACHKPKLDVSAVFSASTGILSKSYSPVPHQPLHAQPGPSPATKPQGDTVIATEEPAKARNQVSTLLCKLSRWLT